MTRRKRDAQVRNVNQEYVEGLSSLRSKCKTSGFAREIRQKKGVKENI